MNIKNIFNKLFNLNPIKSIFFSCIIILVLTLLAIIYLLNSTKKSYIFPPIVNDCPDYYIKKENGLCYDKHNLFHNETDMNEENDYNCYMENFKKDIFFRSNNELCEKKKWALHCKVPWNGISNNDELCINK